MPPSKKTSRIKYINTAAASSSSIKQLVLLGISFLLGCGLSITVILLCHDFSNLYPSNLLTSQQRVFGSKPIGSKLGLVDLRILVAIASYDFSQLPHLEELLDSYLDLCVAGAYVHVVIHTTVSYPVALIDLLNSRLTCTNPSDEAGFEVLIVVKSPALRLNLVDCHRRLFYEKIDDYDLFIYTEDDIRVPPKTVATYLYETNRIERLLRVSPAEDFNVGIVRYEYNYPPDTIIDDATRHVTENTTRVYWEHLSKPIVPKSINAAPTTPLSNHYVYMENHHQGMFLATRALLKAWKKRPNCRFDEVRQRPGFKNKQSQPSEGTQRVWMSSHMLHGRRHCNVQQLIPMDNFGQLTVHHLPNKNYRRVGKKGRLGGGTAQNEFGSGLEIFSGPDPGLPTAMQVHLEMRKAFPVKRENGITNAYRGIRMVDEIDDENFLLRNSAYMQLLEVRMKAYKEYVDRGGIMSDSDMTSWNWVSQD